MEDFQRKLLAAQGYTELGMLGDALAEVDTLDESMRERPEVLEMRTLILMRASRWPEALETARALCSTAPENGAGWVHTAFCLHEMGDSALARDTMLAAPPALRAEPVYYYNLACYECALGHIEPACAHLLRSFAMDKKYREFARQDPDLEPLRQMGKI